MKIAGYILLAGGFLLGAYSTALDIRATNWELFVPGAIAALAGLLVLKRQARGQAQSTEVLNTNQAALNESIGNIINQLKEIISQSAETSTDQFKVEIDRRLRDDLRRFAEARGEHGASVRYSGLRGHNERICRWRAQHQPCLVGLDGRLPGGSRIIP